jgi:hypothetical protein
MRAGNLISQAAIAIWLLACICVAGSFTTFRRRRLASPTSILEIEATHPLVNPVAGRCALVAVSGTASVQAATDG